MELKKGDIIYRLYRNEIVSVSEIVRTGKTFAESSEGYKFKLYYHSTDSIRRKGVSEYGMYSYELRTDELKNKLDRQRLIAKVGNIKFKDQPSDILQKIIELTNQLH